MIGSRIIAFCLALLWTHATLSADFTAVVSARAMHPKGVSHYHLYLYNQDGRLIRKLTSPEDAHDINPVFSPDGDEIVFQRKKGDQVELFKIRENGKKLRRLVTLPEWHHEPSKAKCFTWNDKKFYRYDNANPSTFCFPSPDRAHDLLVSFDRKDAKYAYCQEYPITFWLRDRVTKDKKNVAELPGFESLQGLMFFDDSPFWYDAPLKLALFYNHWDSTTGTGVFALDASKRRIVQISLNASAVYPCPGQHGFLAVCEERYQPLGDDRSVNCLYLDWWDADFKKTRLSPPLSIFGGASIYFEDDDIVFTIPKEPR